jgi:branched-chain amino acid aminotransferase
VKLWYNQSLVESQDAPFENGWMSGNGIFETIRTIEGIPLALSRHMRRAIKGGKTTGIPIPAEDQINEAIASVINANPFPNGRLRICFADNGSWLATHDEYIEWREPARITIDKERIDNEINAPKRFPYTDRLNILERANRAGFDDAIVCNSGESICESAISNLLLDIVGQWITPPLSEGLLAGVMRALVIENLGVTVRKVELEEVDVITGALLLSSLKIAQPVESIGERKLSELAISQRLGAQIRAMLIASSVR